MKVLIQKIEVHLLLIKKLKKKINSKNYMIKLKKKEDEIKLYIQEENFDKEEYEMNNDKYEQLEKKVKI